MATTRTGSSSKSKTTGARSKTAASKSAASRTKSAAPKKTASKAAPKRAATNTESVKRFDGRSTKQPAAFAFLMRQHREVEGWFEEYEKAEGDARKAELSMQICRALKVHTQIEEELLYPQAHEKLDDEDMVDEAYVEHDSAKALIAQIEAMQVGDHMYDAKVKVLGEYVKHHVQEEEKELFPEIARSDIDLDSIGQRLQARAEQLMGEMSGRTSRSGATSASPEASLLP
jgi:hemerythrin superfamily protein